MLPSHGYCSRRHFNTALAAGLSAVVSKPIAHGQQQEPNSDPDRLRVLTYNIYAGNGWPSDRSRAKRAVAAGQMPQRLARELALYKPDLINFSESPSEDFTQEVAEYLGMNHVRFPSGGNWPGTLLSRFEISDSQNVPLDGERPQELFTRHWGRATIKLPSGQPLIVHSAHLFPVADPAVRLKEISAMLASMKADADARRSMLLIGDLNHGPDSEEYQRWMEAGWTDVFSKTGDGAGLTFRSDIPERRIDYVMAIGPIAEQADSCRPLFEGDFRLHIADQESFALSDHLPVLAVFELKKNGT